MNYFFSHIPSDNWTDQAKKEDYEGLGRENTKLRRQIAELEAKDPLNPAINTKENLIATNQKERDNLRTDYYHPPPAQAPVPAAPQPG